RNALDHGIEPPEDRVAAGKPEVAVIHIEARHHAGMLSITVGDDGRGIDPERIREKVVDRGLLANPALAATLSRAELLDFLFLPGFSTAESVSEISGRGVGLDVVKNSVEALGGSVRVTSELTKGTVFHLQLPVTRSVIRAVVAEIASEKYAFPLLRIDRIDRLPLAAVKTMENRQYILIDDTPVSLVSARHVMGVPEAEQDGAELNVVVVSDRKQRFGIVVDEFCGEQDLVVRPLDARLGKIQDIAAAAILIDGTAALIVDVDDMVRSIERMIQGGRMNRVTGTRGMPLLAAKKRVLVVDDSITVRESERQLLKNRGYDVDVAVDGVEGWSSVRNAHYDLVITDIDMPRMNGIELVKSIKGDAKLAGMPVVIVSYKDREEDRMRGLEAGANYYLTKSSFHDDKLVEAVEDLIGGAT
ncbi:MAG TPA: response regulator, partial [Polyangiales bacterium]|nr:response regulator [Polyangiales bacterium]